MVLCPDVLSGSVASTPPVESAALVVCGVSAVTPYTNNVVDETQFFFRSLSVDNTKEEQLNDDSDSDDDDDDDEVVMMMMLMTTTTMGFVGR